MLNLALAKKECNFTGTWIVGGIKASERWIETKSPASGDLQEAIIQVQVIPRYSVI